MRLITLLAAAFLAATAIAQPAQQRQPLPPGTAALRGTISDALYGGPIAGCTVRASLAPGRQSSVVTTGLDGTFDFSGIADGQYFFLVDCKTHLSSCTPAAHTGGPPCPATTLFKDQQRSDVDFKLLPGAGVRGRVVDSMGKPVARASVRIGGPFVGNQVVLVRGTTTKEDGSFELDLLPGGEWALEVELPPMPGSLRFPLVYYPGVLARDEAGLIELITGKIKDGVVISVPSVLDRTLTVRIPPPDATMTGINVMVVRGDPLMSRRLEIDADGLATIKGLVGGRYVVMATATSGREKWADFQAVDLLDQSIDVALQPRPTGRIRGRVVAEGGGVPALDGATIGATWVDGNVVLNPLTPEESGVSLDGTFEIGDIFGQRQLQLIRFDPAWRIHAILHGKTDVTDIGVEIAPGITTEVTVVVRPR